MSFHQAGMIFNIGMIFFQFIYFFSYLLKNIGNSLWCIASDTLHKRITRFNI